MSNKCYALYTDTSAAKFNPHRKRTQFNVAHISEILTANAAERNVLTLSEPSHLVTRLLRPHFTYFPQNSNLFEWLSEGGDMSVNAIGLQIMLIKHPICSTTINNYT